MPVSEQWQGLLGSEPSTLPTTTIGRLKTPRGGVSIHACNKPLTMSAIASTSDSRGGSRSQILQRPDTVDRSARMVSSTERTPDSSKS